MLLLLFLMHSFEGIPVSPLLYKALYKMIMVVMAIAITILNEPRLAAYDVRSGAFILPVFGCTQQNKEDSDEF